MPHPSDTEIADLISQGKLGAICIDTSIAHRTGYNLESGSLAALAQFARGPVSFLVPDVVAGEIKAHMLQNAQTAVTTIRSSIKEFRKARPLSPTGLAKVESELGLTADLEVEVEKRWSEFIDATAGEILLAGDYLDGDELVSQYFANRPPFEPVGKKKSEFPDAIALLELENRGDDDEKYILAVSADDGWQAFAKDAKWVIVLDDLSSALGLFHRTDKYVVGRAVSMLHDTDQFSLANELNDELSSFLDDINPDIQASSYLFYEAEFWGAEYIGHSEVIEQDVTIIDSDEGSVTLSFPISINASISSRFSFSVHDSIDGDYVPLGASDVTREVEVEARVVLQLAREIGPEDLSMSLKVDAPRFVPIDFGEVAPDFGPEEE